MRLSPCGKLRRLSAGDFVGERDCLTQIRTEVGVGLKVGEHLRNLLRARKEAGKNFFRDLLEGELVSLSIQRGDDRVEAQEVADERQIFAVTREIRLRKCTGHDGAEFVDVTHVNDALFRIERQHPA